MQRLACIGNMKLKRSFHLIIANILIGTSSYCFSILQWSLSDDFHQYTSLIDCTIYRLVNVPLTLTGECVKNALFGSLKFIAIV